MTKTKNGMKWLVLALLLVITIGAVVLSCLATPAKAEGEYNCTFRVIITPKMDDANAFARAQGWIGEEEIVRGYASEEGHDDMTDEPVFRFENPQLFGAYGLSASTEVISSTGVAPIEDYRNLRKYLSDCNMADGDFDPEIQIYVLQDVIWCNDNNAKTKIPVLDTYQTLTDVEQSFTAVPLTLHFIGVTDYNDGNMPTMYVGLKSNNYSPVCCNVIFDAVNFRGACKATDTGASNPVYHKGYVADGELVEKRCTGSSYFSVLYVEGCTLEVKNGAGIYNGNGSNTSKGFTRIMVAQYTNAYVAKNHVTVNTAKGDPTTIGNVILRSGTYGYVQAMGNGKVGIRTTNMTENFPEEEYTDVENLKGYYYDYPDEAALAAGDRSDTSRWYEYDYNAGVADAHVVIGGDEVGTCHVDFLNVGHASGDTQLGAGAHLVLDVEEGATIKNFRPGPIKGGRVGTASKNSYSLYQFGTVEINISGGNIDGTGKNSFVETGSSAYGFSGVGYNAGVDGYTGNSEPSYGQAHSYTDYTVNITGGTFTGSFYVLMNSNTYKSTPAYNACVQHGNVTYNIGNADGTGPVFNNTTFRVLQGSYVIAPESDVEFNFNGGTIAKQLWYGAGACVYNPVKVNLNGGTIAEACEGFVAESAFGEKTEVEEPFTGVTVNVPVIVTVDGATIGQYYGAKGGTTNVTTVLGDTSAVSVLKSGTIGSVYMFADAGQSGRMGGTDTVKPMQLNWMVLGEEDSDKTLTIGEYYASGAFYPDENEPTYNFGMGKLYAAQMVAKTTVYGNVEIDPAAAFTAVSDAGLKKPVYTYTWTSKTENEKTTYTHSASNLTWADYEEGDFSGNFYALGNEINQNEGEYSGKYAVDCVLDVHGFDLETRSNDHLFGNVVMSHKLTTDTATGSIYVNIEGTADKHLSITRLAHPTMEVEVPATETTPASTKTVYVDTDEGMIINGLVYTSTVTYERSVNPFLGNVSISLKYVDLGDPDDPGYVHLLKTMQYRGAVSTTLDHCTVNGTFHALSNAATGEPGSYTSLNSAPKAKATVTNTMTDVTFTGSYLGGAINFYTAADVTNVLTNCTIAGDCIAGGSRITSTVGADGEAASRAGVWGIVAGGCGSVGNITSTLTNVTIEGSYIGGNQNSANRFGDITTTMNGVTLAGNYYGACKASTTTSNVFNNINGLDISDIFFGGNDSTGTITGTVTTTITKFHSAANGAEKAFYAGCNNAGTGTTIQPTAGNPAIVLTIDPEKDEDVFFSGLVTLGSNEGNIKGDIIANFYGGVQHSSRHVILGNRQTRDGKIVTGNVTLNVYGGSWGTMYLGGRNNSYAQTDVSTVGDVTLNLYGGAIGSIRKGFGDSYGCYVDGNVTVNIHTDAPENEAIVCDPLVLRGTVDGVVNTFATDEEHPNTPYAVNVISGDKTLYFARDSYTYADGTTTSAMAGANLTADTIEGTLKIAPAANYFYAITCFGDEGYHTSTDPTDVGRVGVGVAEVSFEWEDGVHLTLIGQTDSDLVIAANGAYSTISYVQDGENATWVAVDERPNAPYGTTIILDAKFNVRVLFEKAKVNSVGIDNYQVSYKLNGGEATGVDLVEGTGVYADYYYFIVDDGIDATGFNSVKIAVIVEAGDLNARTTTLTGESILNDLRALGGDNVTLADAISEYSNALNAFVDKKEIPAGEVTDVTDEQIDEYLTGATTNKITLAEGVTAYGITLNVSDTLELRFYLKLEAGAAITSAAIGDKTLENGLTMTTVTVDENTEYTVIGMICGANELVNIHTLTVNGGETGFSASPLSYAKALRAQNANLAQAVINYAYYVEQFAVKAV